MTGAKSKSPLPPTQPVSLPPGPPPKAQPPLQWAYWNPPSAYPPQPAARQLLIWLGLGGIILTLLAVGLTTAAGLALLYRSALIMPGVYVEDLALGRYTRADATLLLQQQWQQHRIILEADTFSQAVSPETLGLRLDIPATVALAHRQGRSPRSLAGFIRNRGRIELEPVLQFDPDLAQQNLAGLAPQFEIPAQPAALRLVSGRVEAVPAVTGQTLDIPATVAQMAQNPARLLDDGRLRLVMQPVAATLTDVSGPAAQANQLLAQPLVLKAYDPINNETVTWYYEPAEWGAWLSLAVKADDPGQLDWSLDADKVRAALTERSAELGSTRFLDLEGAVAEVAASLTAGSWSSWLRVFHHEQQHVVKAGETLSSIGYDYGLPYPWLEQANSNVGQGLRPGQVLTIPSPDVLLPLPVVKNKRIVVSLGEQKMWAYEAGQVKWEWPVSTGITASPTAPGVFQVQTHEPRAYAENWNLWMPNFMGIYRPVPTLGFMNGFHGFPTRNGATLLWTGDLGHPVTYGCILLSSDNAATLYDWAEAGVVVEVRR